MRHILHADFDAFYASVEQLDDPALKGKPVVVGGSPERRGVVAAASYEARRFGVRSAMPMRTALNRCPHAVRVPPRFPRYHEMSTRVMSMFRETTPLVEPLSLDEAFLDITRRVELGQDPVECAQELRRRVESELGLTISVGVASSKSVAKIASGMAKPDGLTVVEPGTERSFLADLPVDRLWGVGPKTAARLTGQGFKTIGQVAAMSEAWWASSFGKSGAAMRRLALGQDDRAVVVEREQKSVSAETTLTQDTGDPEVLIDLVDRLSQRVSEHLAESGVRARTVKVKLRLSDFTTFTRQTTLGEYVSSPEVLGGAAGALLRREIRPGRLFRLVGVGASGLSGETEEPVQPRLEGF